MENGIIEKIPVALSLISKFKLKLLELLVPIFPITALILLLLSPHAEIFSK
jgi:hypothetical protein